LIAVADLLVFAFDSGTFQYRPGQPLNLVWFLFYIPLFFASRVTLRSPLVSARHRITAFASTLNPAPMMTYGVALPLIHLGGYGFGLFDDNSRMVRDLFVLIWVLGASAALAWQYVLLRAQLRLAESAQLAAREEAAELESQLRRGQRIELVGQLSGGLAHEFGNSLFGAESLAQKILRDVRRPGTTVQEANATGLVNALAGSRELIKKFRSLGRGDDTESSVVNVVDEVKSTLELLRSGISRDVSIGFTAQREDISAIARTQDLQQITLNLVLNARDAAGDRGRIAVQVKQGTTAAQECASCGKIVSGNQVSLLVTNNGSGIDPRMRPRIFEPLVTSKPEGKGSGLGLSIVHSLVHQLGGHITLDDLPQGGCTFTVMLPAVQIDVGSSRLPDPALNSRLLVVENDDRIAAAFRQSEPLQQLRPNHVGSYDAAQIFMRQDEHRPVLIVIGNLPDAIDAAAIVADARDNGINVIMCARRSQRAMLASLQGIDVFLDQPVDIDLFSSALLKYLTAVS
jgi:signal transduction histidine kinase